MIKAEKIYKKQNSFAESGQNSSLLDVLPRIQKVFGNIDSLGFPDSKKSIIRSACEELLGKKEIEDNSLPFTLYSYNIDEINQLEDEALPRYLYYRYRYDTFPQRLKLDNFPPCLQIEPSSVCNYRCVFCYQKYDDFTTKSNGFMGTMSYELFKSLIDQAEGNCEAVTLSSRGEPLICPDIEKMLEYAAGKFLALKLNTNAWFLDEEKCHSILKAGVNILVFSVDAASEPAYSQLRVRGNLERVYKNIKLFSEIRSRFYPSSKTITRISGVNFPQSADVAAMKKLWGGIVDQIYKVNYNPLDFTYKDQINDIADPCSELWLRTFVWWNGVVNPCENDYKSTLSVGNAMENSIEDLWRSEKYMDLRGRHISKRRSKCSPCNQCRMV